MTAYHTKATREGSITAIIDSGCTTTISGDKSLFSNLTPCNIKVKCANNAHMICEWRGTLTCSHKNHTVEIQDSLYIPNAVTLVSIDQLTAMGMLVLFDDKAVSFYLSRKHLQQNKTFIKSTRKIGTK